MHAKRYIHYIYIIGIAFLLQGCRKGSHPSTPDTESYAISMAPTSVSASRALINDLTDLQTTGFVVYGHSTASSDKQQVFDGDNVTFDNGEWGYTDTQYWNTAATYCFGAYAPQMGVTENNDITNSLSIGLPQWQLVDGNETDLIVATSQGTAESYLMKGGTVNLDFHHALAQFEVQVVKDATLINSYTLREVTYHNVPNSNNGTATYTLNYTEDTNTWSGITYDIPFTPFNGSAPISDKENEAITFTHLTVPFAERDITITLTYSTNGSSEKIEKSANIPLALTAGEKTVLKLTLNSAAVIVPELHIAQWEEEEIEEDYKTNW